MREAVIVSYVRTAIGKAYKGSFSETSPIELAGHVVRAAVERADHCVKDVDDVILGCALQQGYQALNIGRLAAIYADLPDSVPGMSIDRQCASGLMSIATAAKQIICDNMNIVVAGGVESCSLVQNEKFRVDYDKNLIDISASVYMPMVKTAEVVAKRYSISRDEQDAYAYRSQMLTSAAQKAGVFDDEIIPLNVRYSKQTGNTPDNGGQFISRDEGNRPETTMAGLSGLKPVTSNDGTVTAGNASQLSDGAAAVVVMERGEALRRGLTPLGIYRGMAVAGVRPDEMGIGPIPAVKKLLSNHSLDIGDIDVWELNEAFAVQVLYCRNILGIPEERLNVNGGAISIGHPYGMSGTRMVGHALLEAKRRNKKNIVTTMCVGGGMGAAALFEVYS